MSKVLLTLFLLFSLSLYPSWAADKAFLDFEEHCHRWASSVALAEYNRALSEVRLLHGDIDLKGRSAKEVIIELSKQGYVKKSLYFEYEWDPFALENYTFSSTKFEELEPLPEKFFQGRIRGALLKKGLQHPSYRVRWFVLQYLSRKTEVTPLRTVLKAYVHEKKEHLLPYFMSLLVTERFVKAAAKYKSYPRSVVLRIKRSIRAAQRMDEKAQALFLAVMFTDARPSFEIPVVIYQLEQGYAISYLIRLFRTYPAKWVEEFTVPFREGYGDQHEKLLRIFEHFPQNRKVLAALHFALNNRQKGHFSDIRAKIIGTWQTITGIEYKGSIEPYNAWYKTRKGGKMSKERVTVVGRAANAKGGAVVVVDGAPYYLPQLDEWPDDLLGKTVEVTGIKSREQFIPEVVVDKDGAISQGAVGQQTTIREATWKKVP